MDYELVSNCKAIIGLAQAVVSTDQVGTALDLDTTTYRGWKSLLIEIYIGIGGITFDGTNKLEFKLTHSDDNSTYVSVTADDVVLDYTNQVTNAFPDANGTVRQLITAHAAAEVFIVSYRGKKRYLKLTADFSGTHGTGTQLGWNYLLSHPMSAPNWQTSYPTNDVQTTAITS